MAKKAQTEKSVIQHLSDGLILRKATFEDRERLAHFHANTLLDIGQTGPDENMYAWMFDLMSGNHPDFGVANFTIVEDTAVDKIVSSVGHFPQTWTYEGIGFPFGQPEIVSTDPDYRRRGLVRIQFDEVHRWSAERGEMVQGITGIPWYYRQFGYEMTINLGGGRLAYKPNVPKLKEGETEPYRLRQVTVKDIPLLMEMYKQATSRSMIASTYSEAMWRYDIEGRSEKSWFHIDMNVIETPDGETVGVLTHSNKMPGTSLRIYMYELRPRYSYLTVTPTIMRHMASKGEEYAKQQGAQFDTIAFGFGETHPVYDTFTQSMPSIRKPYAWYIRVPDLPAFLNHIAPALEKRLKASPHAGFSGELKVTFYRSGLIFKFSEGKISVEGWKPDRIEEGDAGFPDLTFLQLLFGYRTLEELEYAFPDCSANNDTARTLLPIIFPKKASHISAGG